MTNSFKLSELSEDTLVGRDIGKKTRIKILNLLISYGNIEIDMENNCSISPSFLDEAIVSLVIELGKDNFSNHITIKNINNGVRVMMNSILHDKLHRK